MVGLGLGLGAAARSSEHRPPARASRLAAQPCAASGVGPHALNQSLFKLHHPSAQTTVHPCTPSTPTLSTYMPPASQNHAPHPEPAHRTPQKHSAIHPLTPVSQAEREMVLIKLHCPPGPTRTEVIQISEIFRARIVDVAEKTVTLCVTGDPGKVPWVWSSCCLTACCHQAECPGVGERGGRGAQGGWRGWRW